MKLLVDAGNSRVKWAWLDAENLRDPDAAPHGGGAFDDALQALRAAGGQPSEILVASVLDRERTATLVGKLSGIFAAPARVAGTEAAALGVRNGYRDFRQLGVDRWLAVMAAYVRFRKAVCVVDAGTAITVDIVAADGSHRGGMIIPGHALMRMSLLRAAAGIRPSSETGDRPAPAAAGWGIDTDSCIERGARRSSACLVEDCMKALQDEAGSDCVLVLTGGDAPALQCELAIPAEHRALLVLEGLAVRYGAE